MKVYRVDHRTQSIRSFSYERETRHFWVHSNNIRVKKQIGDHRSIKSAVGSMKHVQTMKRDMALRKLIHEQELLDKIDETIDEMGLPDDEG